MTPRKENSPQSEMRTPDLQRPNNTQRPPEPPTPPQMTRPSGRMIWWLLMIALLIITYWPAMSLWLPSLYGAGK